MGLANDVGRALSAFSGAVVAQKNAQGVPKGSIPVTDSNLVNEGLLGLTYDVGTAPISFAKGVSEVAPIQALGSLPTE